MAAFVAIFLLIPALSYQSSLVKRTCSILVRHGIAPISPYG